jgi:carbon monoxide dehydrogenase subunit G
VQFENTFDVPLPPRDAWRTLLDIRKVAPCVPGAELTDVVDGKTYKGKVSVRLGPVGLSFRGTVVFEEIDETALFVRASARGADEKGRGGADAKVRFGLEPIPEGTRVKVETTLNLSGSVAQYGRASGIIRGVANQITADFANNLKSQITADRATEAPGQATEPADAAKPISGFSLLLRAVRSWLVSVFGLRTRAD